MSPVIEVKTVSALMNQEREPCNSVNQMQLNTPTAVQNICGSSFKNIAFEELRGSEEISDYQQNPNCPTWILNKLKKKNHNFLLYNHSFAIKYLEKSACCMVRLGVAMSLVNERWLYPLQAEYKVVLRHCLHTFPLVPSSDIE